MYDELPVDKHFFNHRQSVPALLSQHSLLSRETHRLQEIIDISGRPLQNLAFANNRLFRYHSAFSRIPLFYQVFIYGFIVSYGRIPY